MNTNPTKQRQQFYRDYASGQWSMSELCGPQVNSGPLGGESQSTSRRCALATS